MITKVTNNLHTQTDLAAVSTNPLILHDLLIRGASVHARNRANNTPLYLAEKLGNLECVRLLRDAGAHLWLDNDLKREGLMSQGASAVASPRGTSPEPQSHSREEGGQGEVEGEGKGEGEGKAAAVVAAAATAAGEGNAVGSVVIVGKENVVGEGVVRLAGEAEPARVLLLTGDKGKIVG
jgi:lysophospholipase